MAKKKAAYSEYKEVRENMQTYQTTKYDIDKILGIEKTQPRVGAPERWPEFLI